MRIAHFILAVIASRFFYIAGLETGPGSFVGLAYFGLPWLMVNSAFGGYTAWAISKGMRIRNR